MKEAEPTLQNQSLVEPPHSKPDATEPEIPPDQPNNIPMPTASSDTKRGSGGQSLDAHQCEDRQDSISDDKAVDSGEGRSDCGLKEEEEINGRGKLERHCGEIAGKVRIPDIWGQEDFLKDWVDCSGFDAALVPKGIMSARSAMVEEARRANSAICEGTEGKQRVNMKSKIAI